MLRQRGAKTQCRKSPALAPFNQVAAIGSYETKLCNAATGMNVCDAQVATFAKFGERSIVTAHLRLVALRFGPSNRPFASIANQGVLADWFDIAEEVARI